MAENIVDMRKVMRDVTFRFKITHEREMIRRIWLAMLLIKVAARLINCRIEVTRSIIDE